MAATTYFEENFESGSISSDRWATRGVRFKVQSTTVKSGTYSLGTANGTGGTILDSIAINKGGIVYVEFDFRTSDNSANLNFFCFCTVNGRVATPLYLHAGYFAYLDKDYTVCHLPTDTAISTNTWYHFKFTINFTSQTLNIEIDGNSKGTVQLDDWSYTEIMPTNEQLSFLEFSSGNNNQYRYLDNIVVSQEDQAAAYVLEISNATVVLNIICSMDKRMTYVIRLCNDIYDS